MRLDLEGCLRFDVRFVERCVDVGDKRPQRMLRTSYTPVFCPSFRLSDEVKNRPLRELASDPTIMEREVERIRALLREKKRGGQAMATAAASCADRSRYGTSRRRSASHSISRMRSRRRSSCASCTVR